MLDSGTGCFTCHEGFHEADGKDAHWGLNREL